MIYLWFLTLQENSIDLLGQFEWLWYMMTSSNGLFFALLAICAENSPVPGEFPAQRPVTRSFDVFFYLHPNKRLSKQWWGWWFETSPCPLRRHRNGYQRNWEENISITISVLNWSVYIWDRHLKSQVWKQVIDWRNQLNIINYIP